MERLATEPGGFQESDGSMANEGRPIFQPLERAARHICQLECTAGRVGDECVFIELEINEGLRFPPLFGDSGLFIQNPERESVNSGGHPALDEPAMVPVAAGPLLRCPANFPPVRDPPSISAGGTESVMRGGQLPPRRMDVIRGRFEGEGFSSGVVDLFMAATRDNTNSAYASAWRIWSDWCVGRGADPLCNDVTVVTSFLADQAKSKAYSTIGVYRSALSQTLPPLKGSPIGEHPMVVLLMKGIRNQNPPRPKYQSTWDVDMVLNYLRGQENASLSVGALASKLATLLSLATLYRASELAGIDKRSISFTAEGVSFSLSKFRKAQRGGALQSIFLKRLADEQLDPGRCLSRYCEVTEKYRTDENSERLFIGSVGQHPHVKSSTISAWIKKELKAAGVDTEQFLGHSTRGAAASKAAASGVSVESILSAGHWSAESTFTRFYRRDAAINPRTSVAGAVLSLGNIA